MNDEYLKGEADRLSKLLDKTQQTLEGAAARSKVRRARLAELAEIANSSTAPVPSAAIQSSIPLTSPTTPAIAKAPAVSLEDALTAFKAKRAESPTYSAAQRADWQAKFDATQAEIDALTQAERGSVYDAAGIQRVSAAPKPLEPIRSTGPLPPLGAIKLLAADVNTQLSEPAPAVARAVADAKRIAEGWYFLDEAASAIAHQQGFNGIWKEQFCSLMVQEAQRGALPVCHPSTRLPIRDARPLSTSYFVTRDGVNRWLDALEAQGVQGVGYRWEAEPKPQTELVPLLAQSDAQPAPDGAKAALMPGSGKRWTPEVLAEAAAYRTMHGTMATAEKYGVSASLIRKLLPGEKPTPTGYSPFNLSRK